MDEYKYTNKGTVYKFDLTQLTPEELSKFNKLNDKQKLRFIAAYELSKTDDMPEIVSVKSEVEIQDPLKQNVPRYQPYVAKLTELKRNYNEFFRIPVTDLIAAYKNYNETAERAQNNIISLENSIANIPKGFHASDELIYKLNTYQDKYNEYKNKAQEIKQLQDQLNFIPPTDMINFKNNNFTIDDILNYYSEKISYSSEFKKSKKSIAQNLKLLSDPLKNIITSALDNFSEDLNLLKAIDETNIKYVVKEMEKIVNDNKKYSISQQQAANNILINTKTFVNNLTRIVNEQLRQQNKTMDEIWKYVKKDDIFKSQKEIIENTNTEMNKLDKEDKPEAKKIELFINLADLQQNLPDYDSWLNYYNILKSSGLQDPNITKQLKIAEKILNVEKSDVEKLLDNPKLLKSAFNLDTSQAVIQDADFSDEATDTDKRNFRILTSSEEEIKPRNRKEIEEETEVLYPNRRPNIKELDISESGEGYGGFSFKDLRSKVKNVVDAPSEINTLKNEISQLKEEVNMLKDKISNSEEIKHSQIIEAEKLNVPPLPTEKSNSKTHVHDKILDDILKGKELRHIEETKPFSEPQNDSLSAIQKAMAARRADIWDDNDEYEEDDEDWGEGYCGNGRQNLKRKRMLMSDYLSMF